MWVRFIIEIGKIVLVVNLFYSFFALQPLNCSIAIGYCSAQGQVDGYMDIEREIVSYLVKYGNTKESDIVNYGMRKFNRSSKDMKKVVDRIVVKGRIHRIVHNMLKPPEVYLSLKESLYPDVLKALIEADTSEVAEKDAQKILEEAAAVAEKRIRETESREP